VSGGEQYVLIGVARPRERWSSDLARWSTSGAAPIEFVKCLTADEARAVLGSGRRASALMIDARGPGVDRELIDAAAAADTPTVVVSDGSIHRDWEAVGCAAVVDHQLEPGSLLEILEQHCRPVDRSRRPGRMTLPRVDPPTSGRMLAVLGSGGVGTSTVAMATAQALAERSTSVVLVDGARRGDLAMYHDIGDVIPGLPELVEAHRSDRLDPAEVRRLCFEVPTRGYALLLGRRRAADWVTLRRRSVAAAIDALARTYDTAVVDLDPDVDGQADTGSADVGDRHALTLSTLDRADLVLVVGRPGLKGLHSLVGLVDDLLSVGVPAHRIAPVLVASPRSPAARAAASAAVARLGGAPDHEPILPLLHLPRVRGLDEVHDHAGALPASLCRPLGRTLGHLLDSAGRRPRPADPHERIRSGELALDADRSATRSDVA
jgi:cellulose biosynthesis protein BcsQ